MPEAIDKYTPQAVVGKRRRQSFFVWAISAFLAAFWTFLVIIAPVAEAYNLTGISSLIYKICGYICHQMPERTFFIEGHPFAVCARCFGIYFGLFAGFILFPILRSIEKAEPLQYFWLFLAMIPMAVDWSLGFFGIWENTHLSRFLTGSILGAACAAFIVPALIEIFLLSTNRRQLKRLSS